MRFCLRESPSLYLHLWLAILHVIKETMHCLQYITHYTHTHTSKRILNFKNIILHIRIKWSNETKIFVDTQITIFRRPISKGERKNIEVDVEQKKNQTNWQTNNRFQFNYMDTNNIWIRTGNRISVSLNQFSDNAELRLLLLAETFSNIEWKILLGKKIYI